MSFFYGIAVIITIILFVFLAKRNKWNEWMWYSGSAVAAFILAGLFHYIAIQSQCRDHETFSGKVISATFHPWWQSREEVDDYETYTDKDGNTHTRKTGSHYEYTSHPEYWECEANYGSYLGIKTYAIDKPFFDQIALKFCNGKLRAEQPWKSDFHKGDKNIYVADNKNDFWIPTTTSVAFENRIKAGPSLYSFAPVPKDAPIFKYPASNNPFQSNRLLGTAAKSISIRDWDILNSQLGAMKKVNIILIGFGNKGAEIAQQQQAGFIGGKKNDLVICYGGIDPLRPTWVWTFGWTDSNLVKQNLNTLLLNHPVDASILPLISEEVRKNYKIKEWRDFKYLQVEPPGWCYWVYFLGIAIVQAVIWGYKNCQENNLTLNRIGSRNSLLGNNWININRRW